MRLATAMSMVLQSVNVSLPISKHTARMTPTAAAFTASKNADNKGYFLILWTNGLRIVTKIKDGKNIPTVAARAPGNPPNWEPINVAVDNTGPGVIWPTATASINSCLDNKPVETNSASKKANNTYPLP